MPTLIRAKLVTSDHHLGEGVPELEDFPLENEVAYLEMLETHLGIIGPKPSYDHVLNGDWLDYHATRFKGRYGIVPTEEAALAKTDAIIAAHPTYFKGLRRLTAAHPNLSHEITDGNHDPELVRESVQEKVRAALAPSGQEHRVAFHEEIEVGDSVLISHSDELDPLNANPAKAEMFKEDVVVSRGVMAIVFVLSFLLYGTVAGLIFAWVPYTVGGIAAGTIMAFIGLFLVLRWIAGRLPFLWARKTMVQNMPYASYLNAGLGMKLKRRFFPDIGRREDHGDVWFVAIAKKPYAAPVIAVFLIMEAVGHKFFHLFRRPRERFGLRTLWDVLVSTTRPDRIEQECKRFLESRPNVRHYLTGHTHQPKMETYEFDGRTVAYYNSGKAGLQLKMQKPEVVCRTRHTVIETFLRRVSYYWRHQPLKALLWTLVYAALPAGLFAWSSFRHHEIGVWHWMMAALALFLLLWRQSAAEYADTNFIRFTPIEVLEYDDGTVRVRLLQYDVPTRRFTLLTGEEATWDHH